MGAWDVKRALGVESPEAGRDVDESAIVSSADAGDEVGISNKSRCK